MPTSLSEHLHIYPDTRSLQQAVADAWITQANTAIAERGQFYMALSGGSTPKALYQLMASPIYRDQLDWQKCHLFFGDERYVPADHPDSNYHMTKTALFDHVDIPTANIHRIDTDVTEPDSCARAYHSELQKVLPQDQDGWPVFDLMLQGIGDDGHTASLFPGTGILTEQNRNVAAAYVEKFDAWRISVTFPVINHARQILFLVAGHGKAEIMQKVLLDNVSEPVFPVQMINPHGRLDWYLDQDAAALLPAN